MMKIVTVWAVIERWMKLLYGQALIKKKKKLFGNFLKNAQT